MKNTLRNTAEKYLTALRQKRRRCQMLLLLAAIVAAGTVYALILPAVTQEMVCGLTEHTHTDACYEEIAGEPVLICDADDEEHQHSDICYQAAEPQRVLVCELAEHSHNDDCMSKADVSDEPTVVPDEPTVVPDEPTVVPDEPMSLQNINVTPAAVHESRLINNDNSSKLTVIEGADTYDLITVNLYDYGSNINDKHEENTDYPGFQQDGGTTSIGSELSSGSFNFGNNITADLAAGKSNVTNNGGDINKTDNNANSPIEGAMLPRLKNGYPALADGTSLDYLFSDNKYAKKMNTDNINGLFLYNENSGAYRFNSRENHAQFNSEDNTFTLYAQMISPNFMMYPFGNFLPFNDIVLQTTQASLIDRARLMQTVNAAAAKNTDDHKTLAENLQKFIQLMDKEHPNGWNAADCVSDYFKLSGLPDRDFSTGLLDNIYSINYEEESDFYFGMDMSLELMQPKGGYTGKDGKQPMIFYFTGDDDVWVYVDGILFLDLSGIHRHVGGEIDFAKGEIRYYSLDTDNGDVSADAYKTVPFKALVDSSSLNDKGTFPDYSHHTFNFYYMERGAGSGVCRMNFNFPLLRQNSISVTKELSNNDNFLGNPDYNFQILQEDGENLFIGAGVSYELTDNAGNKLGEGESNDNGIFSLKANQTAVFSNIDENKGKYLVRELLPSDTAAQYDTVSMNNQPVTSYQDVTVNGESFKGADSPLLDMADGSAVFSFNNHIDSGQTGSLTIGKKLTEYNSARTVPCFDFAITLDGVPLPQGSKYSVDGKDCTVKTAGIISVPAGKTAIINGILQGSSFEVKETAASAKGYTVAYKLNGQDLPSDTDKVSGVITVTNSAEIIATNTETAIQITIPVQKVLTDPNGAQHTYQLRIEQVSDYSGETPVANGFSQQKDIVITDDPVEESFVIAYPSSQLQTLPQVFYYKIYELGDAEDKTTEYDTACYVAEVTVKLSDDGNYTADISNLWCNGTAASDNLITFNNRLIGYVLPQTGGNGSFIYYLCGIGMIGCAAVGLMMYRRKQKGEAYESNPSRQ